MLYHERAGKGGAKALGALMVAGLGLGAGSQAAEVQLGLSYDQIELSTKNAAVSAILEYNAGGTADQLLYQPPGISGMPKEDILRMGSKREGSVTYRFGLEYDAGTETMTWSLLEGKVTGEASFRNKGSDSVLSYTFPAKAGTGAKAEPLDFNLLQMVLTAGPDSTAVVQDLSFKAGDGLTVTGDLKTAGDAKDSTWGQWIAAPKGENLADYSWGLYGQVELAMHGANSAKGVLGLSISGWNGSVLTTASESIPVVSGDVFPGGITAEVGPVPEPGTWAAGGMMAAAAGLWWRRRQWTRG